MATDSTEASDDKDPNEPTGAVLCPGGDRVVILRDDPAERIGSILLPDTAKQKTTRGRIVAMGPGKVNPRWDGGREPFPFDGGLAVGDIVLLGKYAGYEVEFAGQEYTIMHADELLAKVVPA
jgi:chaperonin GroES